MCSKIRARRLPPYSASTSGRHQIWIGLTAHHRQSDPRSPRGQSRPAAPRTRPEGARSRGDVSALKLEFYQSPSSGGPRCARPQSRNAYRPTTLRNRSAKCDHARSREKPVRSARACKSVCQPVPREPVARATLPWPVSPAGNHGRTRQRARHHFAPKHRLKVAVWCIQIDRGRPPAIVATQDCCQSLSSSAPLDRACHGCR